MNVKERTLARRKCGAYHFDKFVFQQDVVMRFLFHWHWRLLNRVCRRPADREAAQVGTIVPRFRVNLTYRTPEAVHDLFGNFAVVSLPESVQFTTPVKAGPVPVLLDEEKLGFISASHKLVTLR